MAIDVKLGDVPSSTLSDTSNFIFADGENVRKESYADVKNDMLGSANLATKAPKTKESINEMVQDILDTGGYGIISGGVVSTQIVPNMTVQVTVCPLRTSTGARQIANANTSLSITAADTTNARIDIVYVDSTGIIQYLQGTASATPVAPTTPVGGQLLAQINVTANATSITSANIIDKRKILISTDWLNAQLSDVALYNGACAYASNIFTLTLSNAPTTLPNFYTIRFKTTNAWVSGSTFKIGTKTYTPVNANFNSGDVITAHFDEISAKCFFSSGSANAVLSTTADVIYYVTTTGSDTTGDGTIGKPFRTVQKAVNMLPQVINHNVTINVGSGTFSEEVIIKGLNGKGTVTLSGAGKDLTLINNLRLLQCTIFINISNIQATATGIHGFSINLCGEINISNISCIASSGASYGVLVVATTYVMLSNSIISNRYCGIVGMENSTILSNTNSGTSNANALYASSGSKIIKNSTQPSGTTATITDLGGSIL